MTGAPVLYRGNDRLLFGIIPGVLAFRLFARTTLNIAPAMAEDLALNLLVVVAAILSIMVTVPKGLGGASPSRLLIPHLCPIGSLFAPCDPGAAPGISVTESPIRNTRTGDQP